MQVAAAVQPWGMDPGVQPGLHAAAGVHLGGQLAAILGRSAALALGLPVPANEENVERASRLASISFDMKMK